MSKHELFSEVKLTIQKAKALMNSELYTANPIADHFSALLIAYEKLYSQQRRLIQKGDKQLLQLNRLLRQITIILDNIPVGIVIVNAEGIIQPSYSQHMHTLFDLKKISGMFIEDVLYFDDQREEERETFKNWLKLVFDTSHDWDLIGGIAPDIIEYDSKDGQMLYSTNYHRIINENHETSLMIYLVDITERMRQKMVIQKQKNEHNFGMEIFSALLSHDNSNDTSDFIYETKKMLNRCQQLFNNIHDEEDKAPSYNNIFRLTHSIKGLSKTYGMNELARLAHSTEEILNQLRSNKITFETGLSEGVTASEKVLELFKIMKNLLENAEKILHKIFKKGAVTITATRAQRRGVKVESERIDELIHLCETLNMNNPDISQHLSEQIYTIKNRVKELVFQPLDIIFDRLFKIVNEVSASLNKEAELKISGDRILLSDDSLHLIISSLIHLLRNSLDHGIESSEIRKATGKSLVGQIKIHTTLTDKNINILFEDDGAGIDPDAIAEKASEKGIISRNDIETLSYEDKINIIFLPGFSSRDVTTEVSGRGVGLDVVHDSMVKLGGSVKIESEINKSTRFYLSFPITKQIK